MTKQDYTRIAVALRVALDEVDDDPMFAVAWRAGVRLAASRIADVLQVDNARFDRERFMAAVNGTPPAPSSPTPHRVERWDDNPENDATVNTWVHISTFPTRKAALAYVDRAWSPSQRLRVVVAR